MRDGKGARSGTRGDGGRKDAASMAKPQPRPQRVKVLKQRKRTFFA